MVKHRWVAWGWIPLWLVLWGWHVSTIGRIPAGLFYDEAFNALDALHLPEMGWPVFLQGNFGREPLLVYLIHGSLRAFGPSAWSVRLPVALCWGWSVVAFVWLLRELFPGPRGKVLSSVGAILFATTLWFAVTAHYAIRTNVFVLSETLFIAALWRGWRKRDIRWAGVAGVWWGVSFYTYLPNRLLPLVLLGPFLVVARREWPKIRERQTFILIVILAALVIMSPLLAHFVQHPRDFLLRTSQVTLVGGEGKTQGPSRLGEIFSNTKKVLGMFFLQGDMNPRNNLPGRPVFTWWAFPLLLAGLLMAFRRLGSNEGFLLWWAFVMILPTWLTEYAPHFQRAIGAVPPVMALTALGAEAFTRWFARGRVSPLGWLVVLLLLSAEGFGGIRAFKQWSQAPVLYYAFDEGLTEIGRYLTREGNEGSVFYLTPQDITHPTLRFFLETSHRRVSLRSFDGRHVVVLNPQREARYIVVVHDDFRFFLLAPWLWPRGGWDVVDVFRDREGKVYAQVVDVPAHTPVRSPLWKVRADWEDHIRLLGADPVGCCTYKPGEIIYLQLWWSPLGGVPSHAWTVFTHLVDETGHVVAGKDCEPGCGSYPTTRWHEGEWIVAEYQILVPKEARPGRYTIETGWYNWRTGHRLPLSNGQGDAVVLGHVEVSGRGNER